MALCLHNQQVSQGYQLLQSATICLISQQICQEDRTNLAAIILIMIGVRTVYNIVKEYGYFQGSQFQGSKLLRTDFSEKGYDVLVGVVVSPVFRITRENFLEPLLAQIVSWIIVFGQPNKSPHHGFPSSAILLIIGYIPMIFAQQILSDHRAGHFIFEGSCLGYDRTDHQFERREVLFFSNFIDHFSPIYSLFRHDDGFKVLNENGHPTGLMELVRKENKFRLDFLHKFNHFVLPDFVGLQEKAITFFPQQGVARDPDIEFFLSNQNSVQKQKIMPDMQMIEGPSNSC